jgi:hypothetical protein
MQGTSSNFWPLSKFEVLWSHTSAPDGARHVGKGILHACRKSYIRKGQREVRKNL